MGLITLYLERMFGYMLVFLPFYIVGRVVFLKRVKKQTLFIQEVILALFMLYIVGLASQTIIPSWDMGVYSDTGEFFFHINMSTANAQLNFIPFHTLYQYFYSTNVNVDDWGSVSLLNITANLLLFSPIGFFVPILWKEKNRLKTILLLGLLVTTFVESIQYFIGRSIDIDDVILNTVGVIIGFGFFRIFRLNPINMNIEVEKLKMP
ncbi:glycopeptide antibiotics resistance protein [Bacillus sp. SORGH_AS 510]|uniref:VanZ family protein n=1 Tax=Bacillus sp. SORGH_AS_0510 TaxID=3041771 RepID=UPI002780E78A|nr:VanZ family protein [Bacillus sp. SORGH_AS_0510]MDQ1144038.1 glycopeptide antibiotics resistance protein [Bacillus sp. SORGH_AS_0510]